MPFGRHQFVTAVYDQIRRMLPIPVPKPCNGRLHPTPPAKLAAAGVRIVSQYSEILAWQVLDKMSRASGHPHARGQHAGERRVTLEAPAKGHQPTERDLHVLVVDDDNDAAENLCALLRFWGYQSQARYDAVSALSAARDHHPDCVLVDIDMPGLAGYRLAQRLRMQPGVDGTKLVALSTHADEPHVACSREAGFDFYFTKPIEPRDIGRLKRLMDTLNQLVSLAGKTEEMTRQNLALTNEMKELIKVVKSDMEEVKEEIIEIKDDVNELKEELRESKNAKTEEYDPKS
jgi:CheY-like chemotaxis protein